jgi:hypothetical protein
MKIISKQEKKLLPLSLFLFLVLRDIVLFSLKKSERGLKMLKIKDKSLWNWKGSMLEMI